MLSGRRGDQGPKIDQKTHARNQNQVQGSATSFLAGETVGFCLNAPAGPTWSALPKNVPYEFLQFYILD
jgi:hypothetical protein